MPPHPGPDRRPCDVPIAEWPSGWLRLEVCSLLAAQHGDYNLAMEQALDMPLEERRAYIEADRMMKGML